MSAHLSFAVSRCITVSLSIYRYIVDYINRVEEGIKEGDESMVNELPVLHATLSGMKAVATTWAHESIEECRKCCGGQGFLMSSGVCKLSPDFSEWVTVEGTP
jgi:acyl-CoA oxidase